MLSVVFHPTASKEILKIPKEIRLLILGRITELEKSKHPLEHRSVIKLRQKGAEDFRMRVGDYRIKFTLRNSRMVLITHVQHRQVGYY